MGVRAAQESDVPHPRQVYVIDKQRLPRQQARVFIPFDAFPEVACLRHCSSLFSDTNGTNFTNKKRFIRAIRAIRGKN